MTQPILEPFRTGLFRVQGESARLLASKCSSCGALAFPRRAVCAACNSFEEPEIVELSEYGRLYTFAVVRQAPKQFPVPYVIGYVDTDDGVRVFTRVAVDDFDALRLGARVRCVVDVMPASSEDAAGSASYSFRPVDGE